jgi:hypothetical protein
MSLISWVIPTTQRRVFQVVSYLSIMYFLGHRETWSSSYWQLEVGARMGPHQGPQVPGQRVRALHSSQWHRLSSWPVRYPREWSIYQTSALCTVTWLLATVSLLPTWQWKCLSQLCLGTRTARSTANTAVRYTGQLIFMLFFPFLCQWTGECPGLAFRGYIIWFSASVQTCLRFVLDSSWKY